MRILSGVFFIFLSVLLSGCVFIPAERITEDITARELSGHVTFLAQPALKGRKPGSWESGTVRKYLADRFSAYGLLPWGNCDSFAQPFGLGTNIVGILPGAGLSDEIILLSAHYDHVGRTKDGMCPGAGDNASGAAAVLEIAERLSQSDKPLKRTVCFALFDTEESGMVGSMLFSMRDDFKDANITAAVTIDMLGRELFDVVDGSLCLIGAEKFPSLRESIAKSASENRVKLLPLGSEFVGPRGDHISFRDSVDMSLFFTCGLFPDYHKPTDTPDKLDYKKMKGSTETICRTVVALADAEKIETAQKPDTAFKDELGSLNYIFDKLYLNYEKAGVSEDDNKKLLAVAEKIRKSSTDRTFTAAERRKFVRDVLEGILPVVEISDEGLKKNGKWMVRLNEIFNIYMDDLIVDYKKVLKEVSQNRLSVFLFGREYWFKRQRFDVDEDMSLIAGEDGLYELDLISTNISFNFNVGGLFSRKCPFHPFFGTRVYGCTGTKEQIIDYCLLRWGSPRRTQNKVFTENWQKVVARIDNRRIPEIYEERFERRLKEGGFKDREEWVLALLESGNEELLKETLSNPFIRVSEKVDTKIAAIVTNKQLSADIRRTAIMASAGKVSLSAVVDVLYDSTVYKPDEQKHRSMRKSFPLKYHTFWMMGIEDGKISEDLDKGKSEKQKAEIARLKEDHKQKVIKRIIKKKKGLKAEHIMFDEQASIGDIALKHLKAVTNQNFKKNKTVWKKWILENAIKCGCKKPKTPKD